MARAEPAGEICDARGADAQDHLGARWRRHRRAPAAGAARDAAVHPDPAHDAGAVAHELVRHPGVGATHRVGDIRAVEDDAGIGLAGSGRDDERRPVATDHRFAHRRPSIGPHVLGQVRLRSQGPAVQAHRLVHAAVSDALPRHKDGAGEPSQDGLLHVLHEPPAVHVVGQHHEGEPARRDEFHEQAMAVQRPAVGQRGHLADPADVPAEAHLVVGAVLAHLRRLHLRQPWTFGGTVRRRRRGRRSSGTARMHQVRPDVTRRRPSCSRWSGRAGPLRSCRRDRGGPGSPGESARRSAA